MTHPVENLSQLTRQIAADELPYEEAMVRLYELRDRYDAPTAVGLVGSAAQQHLAQYGHRLAFGCCRDLADLRADLDSSDRAYLIACAKELHGLAC